MGTTKRPKGIILNQVEPTQEPKPLTSRNKVLAYLIKHGESKMSVIYKVSGANLRNTRRLIQQLEYEEIVVTRTMDCCGMKLIRLVGTPKTLNI